MTKHVSPPTKGIRLLAEHTHRVAHGRAELADRSDLIWTALTNTRDTVTRFTTGSRNRTNLGGRTAARNHDTGILLAVGKPALNGYLSDGLPTATLRTPDWDTRDTTPSATHDPGANTDLRIAGHTHADGKEWIVSPTEDLALDHVTRDEPPVWSTEEHICADWTRLLRRALDADDSTVLEHSTTLTTLAALRMHYNAGIGYIEYDPALGRDGRVSLPEVYESVPVISIYVQEERLLYDVDTVKRIAEQRGHFNPNNEFVTMPDVEPPSNGFLER